MELTNQILSEIYTYLGRKPQTVVLFQEYDSSTHSTLYQLIDGDNYILIGILVQDPDPDSAYATIAAWHKLNDAIMQYEDGTHGACAGWDLAVDDDEIADMISAYVEDNRNNPITWLKERM